MAKSIDFNEKNNNNNAVINSTEKNINIFFKIYYNYDKDLYYLVDIGVGYGTF